MHKRNASPYLSVNAVICCEQNKCHFWIGFDNKTCQVEAGKEQLPSLIIWSYLQGTISKTDIKICCFKKKHFEMLSLV